MAVLVRLHTNQRKTGECATKHTPRSVSVIENTNREKTYRNPLEKTTEIWYNQLDVGAGNPVDVLCVHGTYYIQELRVPTRGSAGVTFG